MYTSIYQNSYIVLVISFILLSVICYIFQFGYTTEIINGKVKKKFSWKYPLAISLIIWVFWHFYLYPSTENIPVRAPTTPIDYTKNMSTSPGIFVPKTNKLMAQKINMMNWN